LNAIPPKAAIQSFLSNDISVRIVWADGRFAVINVYVRIRSEQQLPDDRKADSMICKSLDNYISFVLVDGSGKSLRWPLAVKRSSKDVKSAARSLNLVTGKCSKDIL